MSEKEEKLKKLRRENRSRYRKRRKEVTVSFAPDDFKGVAENAKKAGLTVTEFIRDTALKKRIKAVDLNEKYRLEYKAEIRRIGGNLNQIARALNQKYVDHTPAEFQREVEQIEQDLKNLLRVFQ